MKGRFYAQLPDGNFLSVTVWPSKNTPNSDVIVTEIRKPLEKGWETVTRLAIFRTPEGRYVHLPERRKPTLIYCQKCNTKRLHTYAEGKWRCTVCHSFNE